MKTLILTNNDVGLYKFRKELIIELLKLGQVIIALPYGEFVDKLEEIGCRFINTPMNRRGTNPINEFKLIRQYMSILDDVKPDVVLTYTIKPNAYGGWACQKKNVPYISNVTGLGTSIENGGLLSFITTALYRIGLMKAECVFFQNAENRELFCKKGIVSGRTRLLPGSGVDLATYSYQTYPTDEDGFRFLFVGRIMKDKGIEEFLAAIRDLHREQKKVTADIVGGSDEDYSPQLQLAESEGAIHYHGHQTDVYPFYCNCHCVVLPSYHEGMSNVLLEASATGRPIIATMVSGCKETFEEGVTGFGCEVRDYLSLLKAMHRILSLSNKEREQFGIAARKKMTNEYDRNLVIHAYIEEISKIVEGKP